jgi:anti-anti-sigma factor
MSSEIIRDTHLIVRAFGEIDFSNVAEFAKTLDEAVEEAPQGFIIDLTDAGYFDSSGISAILAARSKVLQNGGCLVVVPGSVRTRSVMETLRLGDLAGMSVCESVDDARRALPCKQGDER